MQVMIAWTSLREIAQMTQDLNKRDTNQRQGAYGAVLGPAFGLHGFADQSHFTRVFGREVGCGPGQWRRLLTFSKILVIVSASIASISTSFSDLTIFSVVVL